MRKGVYAIIGLGLVAVIVIGLVQSSNSGDKPSGALVSKAPSTSETQKAFAGSPPPIAALHTAANQLLPGGKSRFRVELAQLKGHPAVVNLWASWCGPCRLEFPLFQQQAVRYGRDVAFLGVNSGDNEGDAKSFLAKFPVTYPSVEDGGQRIAQQLGLRGLPGTAYYDAKGKLLYVHQGGYNREADLARDIERYLGVRARSS